MVHEFLDSYMPPKHTHTHTHAHTHTHRDTHTHIYIYIHTNLLHNSVYGDKEKEKDRQNSVITIYLESLPGEKRKNVTERKKEKANLVTPIEKNQEIRNQWVKRTSTHRKMLRCYNYKDCSILGRAKLQINSRVRTILLQFRLIPTIYIYIYI